MFTHHTFIHCHIRYTQSYPTVRLLTLAWVPVRAHGVDVFFEREEQETPRPELAGMQAGFSQIDPFCAACEGRR